MKTLEEVLDMGRQYALASKGNLDMPLILAFDAEDTLHVMAVDMPEPGIKRTAMAMILHQELKEHRIIIYAYVSAAWVSSVAGELGVEPRFAPDARDVITVCAATDHEALLTRYDVRKLNDSDGVALEPGEVLDTRTPGGKAAGRFVTLLAPDYDPTGRRVTFGSD